MELMELIAVGSYPKSDLYLTLSSFPEFRENLAVRGIKAGREGPLHSLHQFIDQCEHAYAVRFHARFFSVEKVAKPSGEPFLLLNLPYYLSTRLDACLDWLLTKYPVPSP
jgi:hypothetical protein